ncbi:MAG: dTDP-4-amino-4,6-dideoxygalactose transaminase [Melioribacteraceae bacterium]|nr:dTDP-4-amino-4,6-dideoxygalactose transaminase [Melioribacteraceae bacterium]
MIPFNRPLHVEREFEYIQQTIINNKISGDGEFSKRCHEWFEKKFRARKVLLTTSCTHALEMAALLIDIQEGDEVIMPSYTFVSTANAFVLRGAKIVFVDVRPDTMNIDETKIEAAITDKTKVIVPVHYGGVACEMDEIMKVAKRHNLIVVEDAAQAVMSLYKDKAVGTIGHLGTYSFHETKNYSCGEGGALLINDKQFIERAEIIREKGTNRSRFLRGQVDKYSWVELGSSYLPSELNAAMLFAQLEQAEGVNSHRKLLWETYYFLLEPLNLDIQYIPECCEANGHLFYIKTADLRERTALTNYLNKHDIYPVFHYVPLHTSQAGKKFSDFYGNDQYTTKESERLLRLPMYYELSVKEVEWICELIHRFYSESTSLKGIISLTEVAH